MSSKTLQRTRHILIFGILWGLLIAPTTSASAQTVIDMDVRGTELTREELTELLERLEQAASAPGYSGALRSQAAREASYVRQRLEEGDFRVGDRVVLIVRNEPQLSDTIAVTGDRTLELPQVGPVSLDGVLRSELESHMTDVLSQYVREPRVQARALIRIAVLGSVGNPGFYTLPASALLEEAIMVAGGPAGSADVDDVRVRRGEEVVWEGEPLQQAMIEGRTLDQLSLQAGDRIVVPRQTPGLFERGIIRTLLVTIPPAVYLLARVTRIF